MTKLTRLTAKIFGETADATLADPQIGQFGSGKAGTYVGTADVATIQSLPAWSTGWIDAVTPTQQFPALPEMTGVHKVLSYQEAYLLQQGIPEWDSSTTYYENNFCAKDGKIYFSKTDSNLNNDPTADTVNWDEFKSGNSRSIGEIVTSTIPLTDAGLHLLDGALIQGSGAYDAFVSYIADLYDSGDYPAIFETEANWQTSVTTYGVCGKFVYDSVNNTVRLPKITGIVEGTTDLTALGDLIEAGLPNITGSFPAELGNASTTDRALGAFYNMGVTRSGGGGEGTDWATGFDASRSSSIYGNSSTVQPQTIKVLYYIVIATSTKTEIEVDIDEIATDLNGKADVDLTNVNNSGTSKGASWALPSSTYKDLTLGASGSTYTAPANGWFYIKKGAGSKEKYLNFEKMIDSVTTDGFYLSRTAPTSASELTHLFPVCKNDTVKINYDATGSTIFRFYYAQGSESEA